MCHCVFGRHIYVCKYNESIINRYRPYFKISKFVIQYLFQVGLIRRPATFLTSITDERGDELMYSGVRISEIVKKNSGIGGVLGLLWFQRELPEYFCKFLELCLIVTADHGPAVSGAHNTIVAARAGTYIPTFI